MLLNTDSLSRRFSLASDQTTGQQALQAAGDLPFIVISFQDGKYAVVRPEDLYNKLKIWNMLDTPLCQVPPQALAPYIVPALQRSQVTPEEAYHLAHLEEDETVVILDGASVLGLARGFHRTRAINTRLAELGAEEPPPPQPPVAGEKSVELTTSPLPPSKRYVNVRLKDRGDKLVDPAVQTLAQDQVYSLIFDIDIQSRLESLVKDTEFRYTFKPGEQMAVITVRLETEDFEIYDEHEKKLFVPPEGPSKNQASFSLAPRHDGELVANAVFLKDGNFIQLVTLKFNCGAGPQFVQETQGRDLQAISIVQPRDVSLTIINMGESFQLILSGATAAMATLRIKLPELKDMVAEVRQALMDVINTNAGGQLVYQAGVQIPQPVSQQTLVKLAEAGFRLYQRIFFSPASDLQTQNLGKKLRELLQKDKCKVQIFSQDFVLPWGLLYLADRFNPADIQPGLFMGLTHIIEHIPLQQNMQVLTSQIDASAGLNVSLNLNQDIDQAMGFPLIKDQVEYWQEVGHSSPKVKVLEHTTRDEVAKALDDPANQDQVIYFYCHGISQDVGEAGGPDASALVLSNNGWLTLKDLNLYAPMTDPLPGAPLVFINACESAEVSPLVFDGFVPYFLAKGARGVIGTECKVPARFALEWSGRFFDRFLEGETLGEIFLSLRQEFFQKENNLLGLLYALYVDCDTKVVPPLLAH